MNKQSSPGNDEHSQQQHNEIPMWIWGATTFIAAYLLTTLIGDLI